MNRFVYQGLTRVYGEKGLLIDLKYASTDNFTGKAHYETELCLVHSDILPALQNAARRFREDGLQLKIWDAYRPVSVQKALYEATPKVLKAYVPAPSADAPHPRGCALDVTLTDKDGKELAMPTGFDDFSRKAHADFPDLTQEQRENRDRLIHGMNAFGFEVSPLEWWHFNYRGWRKYPLLDVRFSEFLREIKKLDKKEKHSIK